MIRSSLLILLTFNTSVAFTIHQSRLLAVNSIGHTTNKIHQTYAQQKEGDSKPFFLKDDDETTVTQSEESNISSRGKSQEILDEAQDALISVGWSAPMAEAELTSDDPFVKRINDEIRSEMGVDLDELLNPAKVCDTFSKISLQPCIIIVNKSNISDKCMHFSLSRL